MPTVHVTHQGGEARVERVCKSVQVDDAHVAAAALDIADVAGVKAGGFRQALLRHPTLKAPAANRVAKRDQDIRAFGIGHATTLESPAFLEHVL